MNYKWTMGQIFVAFSEYLNSTTFIQSREFHMEIDLAFEYSNPAGDWGNFHFLYGPWGIVRVCKIMSCEESKNIVFFFVFVFIHIHHRSWFYVGILSEDRDFIPQFWLFFQTQIPNFWLLIYASNYNPLLIINRKFFLVEYINCMLYQLLLIINCTERWDKNYKNRGL